jgi:type I restriction enzyme R subunit
MDSMEEIGADNSEFNLEVRLVARLVSLGYVKTGANDAGAIWDNVRRHVDRLNAARSRKLTDAEFGSLKRVVSSFSVFDCAKILKGRSLTVEDGKGAKRAVYIVSDDPSENVFEVGEQVKVRCRYDDRFDVTLFLNGFPFIQIELKAAGVAGSAAFDQVIRYKNEGAYDGVFHFLRYFVVSDEANTRYFCNNDSEILRSNQFWWSDAGNVRVPGLMGFAESQLNPKTALELGAKYMAVSESEKRLMVLRPYQYFAIKALEQRCLSEKQDGFVWHTMGSGKTLTSFMFAKTLAENPLIDKVFFIVDRTDIDKKSIDDFKAYDPEFDQERASWTGKLVEEIKSRKLIVSTIFKLDKAVKAPKYARELQYLKGKKIVLIYDECHRSQVGSMRKDIDAFFGSPLSYGFTGTPVFAAQRDVPVTADIFKKCVHMYLIHQAIADGNILPMSPSFIKTVIDKNNVSLDETIKKADTKGIIEHPKRVALIAQDILYRYPAITIQKRYNAILACNSIHELILYYDWFRANAPKDFSFAAVFTFEENQEMPDGEAQPTDKDALFHIMKDYSADTGRQFSFDQQGRKAYDMELADRFGNRTLDLLIVVNKYLTGANFKRCNTLFLDKALRSYGLIQAFARTVRTEKDIKTQGNIVCYQTTEDDVNAALTEYSNGDNANIHSLARPYDQLLADFASAMAETRLTDPDSRSKKERDGFIAAFGKALGCFARLRLYPNFSLDGSVPGVSSREFNLYKSKYKDIWDERS